MKSQIDETLTDDQLTYLLTCCRSIEDSVYRLTERHHRTIDGKVSKVGIIRSACEELIQYYPMDRKTWHLLQGQIAKYTTYLKPGITSLEITTVLRQCDLQEYCRSVHYTRHARAFKPILKVLKDSEVLIK